jgi:hypothetical protein
MGGLVAVLRKGRCRFLRGHRPYRAGEVSPQRSETSCLKPSCINPHAFFSTRGHGAARLCPPYACYFESPVVILQPVVSRSRWLIFGAVWTTSYGLYGRANGGF